MIILYNPRATKLRNRRLPLSVLSMAAVLEDHEAYVIVDGNLDLNPTQTIMEVMREETVDLLAVSVMPGPQVVGAVQTCSTVRALFPHLPIVWGGYFPSNYTDTVLNADYVDFAVRGQGEDTFLELIEVLKGKRDLKTILGLSYKEKDGTHRHNPDRPLIELDAFSWYPYHRVPVEKYLLPTFLGTRTAVHQASIGCPFRCNFCGVVPFSGSREKMESPSRTEAILRHLATAYGANAVQFYDNNFFLSEDHARELMERMAPLGLRWWAEARIDLMLRFSDATFEAVRQSGCSMIFFGAESGSDWVLKQMKKDLKAEQTLELAARIRRFGIIPEFGFVFGNPDDPERETREDVRFIQKIKKLNPQAEIIVEHYTPVPQRDRMYGDVEAKFRFPTSPDEWATERWQKFATQKDPGTPWLRPRTKRLIDNFDLVVSSRWPTVQDIRLRNGGRRLLSFLSAWRYRTGVYSYPIELKWVQRLLELRKPKADSL